MEQRIGSSSQPLDGAGVDPAYIPGLTSPASGTGDEPSDGAERRAADAESPAAPDTDGSAAEPEASGGTDAPADAGASTPADEADAEAEPELEPEPEDEPDGPVFEAADRRARIVADAKGVRLSLDDQACEFRWDEIGAVETESPRFGKRFTVTVHTPDRRWYPIEIEAAAKSRHKEWEARLDEVLDAYFDDGADDEVPDETGESEASDVPEATAGDSAEPADKADAEPADTDAKTSDDGDEDGGDADPAGKSGAKSPSEKKI
ncbi:hypothetical protein [Streptomyces sp. NPDC008150]|uniref:hypothetical protein n=1 Tax=Streptomyces sp. NPDC008150 TaxID=3364816 RepID=UPI0036E880E5